MLEPHTLTLESSRRSTLAAYTARRESVLRVREDEKERRRREALRRVAPGFDGNAETPLEPVRSVAGAPSERHPPLTLAGQGSEGRPGRGDVMDDLVDQLEKMVGGTAAADRKT